jgi:signal transduction histidine kinase/DNA-binding response OmpR family regulator
MSHARLRILIIGATTVVLLALGLLVARLLWRGELMSVTAAEGVVTRAADVAQSLLNRHLLQVEGQITSLGELMGQDFLDAGDADRTSRALREMTAHSFTYRNLMLADIDGLVWASAVETRRGRPMAIPAATLQAALQPDAASIFGPVPHPQTGELMLVMVRRIPTGTTAAGALRPDMLAVAEIPTALITSALAPMVNPSALRIRLERSDGMVLAAGPGQEELEGRVLAAPTRLLMRQESVVRSPNRQGGGDVLGTARAIFYPDLVAVAVLPEDVALAEWEQIRRRILGGAALVATLVVAFSAALLIALSARQRAALEREAASRRLVDAVESLPDGFVLWDAEDRLVVCNSRYRTLMGLDAETLVPGFHFEELVRSWLERGLFRIRTQAPLDVQVALALESHRAAGGYFEREMADGRWLRIAQQRVAEGGTVVILCEITAARQTMAALGEARDAADRATAAKSRLLAHVSHELRTPLSGLLRLADRMGGEASLSAAQRRQASLVGATARHLLALANEVLDLAAMEARSLTLNIAPTPAATIFEDALAMVQPLAEAKEVRLSFMAEGLPAFIEADATRLRQMVLNLLANAVKFTPRGSTVRLDATVHSSPALLRFEIADQGPGVPESERDRLFTDFTRLAPSEAEGTGLGLSITARLAALMDGRIGCTDARGGTGACFWVELPLVLAAGNWAGEERAGEEATDFAPIGAERRLRLLAVDDVPANLSVLRALLATTGFDLETVTEGAAALEAAAVAAREGRPFDAVLMDMMMPGMDGIETTRRLRAMPGAVGRVPVIAVTASAFPEDVAACRAAGMVAHLSKPVERGQLLRVLAELLSPTPAEGAVPGDLGALRPLFLAELRKRLDQMEAAGPEKRALLEAVHAIAGTVGHLGELELVATARGVLKALREEDPAVPEMVRGLLEELRRAFPRFAAVEAAA